jgi:hypothetical protein
MGILKTQSEIIVVQTLMPGAGVPILSFPGTGGSVLFYCSQNEIGAVKQVLPSDLITFV